MVRNVWFKLAKLNMMEIYTSGINVHKYNTEFQSQR
jgi:hypothetical protein